MNSKMKEKDHYTDGNFIMIVDEYFKIAEEYRQAEGQKAFDEACMNAALDFRINEMLKWMDHGYCKKMEKHGLTVKREHEVTPHWWYPKPRWYPKPIRR